MTISYNLKNIRILLTEGFTHEELRRLCYDTFDFRSVYNQLAEGMSNTEIIDRLLEYADRKLLIETLLAVVKEANPARYEKHQPYYDMTTGPVISSGAQEKSLRAFPTTSPYVISGPVSGPHFYNRHALLTEITSGQHRAMYVIGGRQMGKTSLLRQIKEMRPVIDLDVQFAGGNFQEFPKHLLYSIKRQQGKINWLPTSSDLQGHDFFDILQAVAHAAEDNHELIYLLIDESDGLIDDSEVSLNFLHRLRGLSQTCAALRLVLVASRRLSKARALFREAQMSPLLDGFAAFFLTPFSESESANLLQAINTNSPIQIPIALQQEIIRLSGGHPHFLQLLGYHLYKNNIWGEVTEDILNQIDHIASGIFANDFATLTGTERRILKLVSQHNEISFADLQANIAEVRLPILLEGLVSHGYLRRLETGYTTGSVFLDRWLDNLSPAEWIEPSPVPEERAFDLVSRAEQIKNIQALLVIRRRNLQHLREMEALHSIDRPLYLLNGIAYEEEQIKKLQAELDNLKETG